MVYALFIGAAIVCSIPQTDYCGTNDLKPINLEKFFEDEERPREYRGMYDRSNKIMYFDGKPYLQLEEHPIPKSE